MVTTYTHIPYTQTLEQGVVSHVPQDDKIILIIASHSLKPILVMLYKAKNTTKSQFCEKMLYKAKNTIKSQFCEKTGSSAS